MRVVTITTGGSVLWGDVEKIDLEFLKAQVDGWIELVPVRGTTINMYLNEEGKLEGLPFNELASRIAWRTRSVSQSDAIVGNVVLVGAIDDEGDDTGLEDEAIKWIEEMVK
jgi:hypothetical protein